MSQFPVEVQRQFEQALLAGEYAAGDVLSIDELAERFKARSRDVRTVMAAEARKGLVEKIGAARFEVRGIAEANVGSVFVHAQEHGLKPRSEVRRVVIEPASEVVAEKLQVELDTPVYRFERTRWVGGTPLANQINYMPFEICPGLEDDDVSHASFKRLLERKYLVFLAEADENLDLAPAGAQDQEVLGLQPGSSVLRVDRLARSRSGSPVVWATLHIDPQRYDDVAELWPEAAKLLQAAGHADETKILSAKA
jgi:GntR family transcriptional regulator